MAEQNRRFAGNNTGGEQNSVERSMFVPAPLPVINQDAAALAERQAKNTAATVQKQENEANQPMVDSVPIFLRRSSIDAEVEAMKKAPTKSTLFRANDRFSAKVAASRLQEQAAARPGGAPPPASLAQESPEELVAKQVASQTAKERPQAQAPTPEVKPLERPLTSTGGGGPRALVTPVKPTAINSMAVKRLAVHAAPSSLRTKAPTRSNMTMRPNPLITKQSPTGGRGIVTATTVHATRPIVGRRGSSAAPVAQRVPLPGQSAPAGAKAAPVAQHAPGSAGAHGHLATKAAPVAQRAPVMAGRPVPKAAPVAQRPAVVAGQPVKREARVVGGNTVVAGRPANADAPAPKADEGTKEGADAKPGAKTRSAGHFLKRRESGGSLRKRPFVDTELDLTKLPWKDAMLKLAAVPLMSDFYQVSPEMFQNLSGYIRLDLRSVNDYFSDCYFNDTEAGDRFVVALSMLADNCPEMYEAFNSLPTEEVDTPAGSQGEEDSDKADKSETSKTDGDDKEADKAKDSESKDDSVKEDSKDKDDVKKAGGDDSDLDGKDEEKGDEEPKKATKGCKKLVLLEQPLAVNTVCYNSFLKTFYPGLKRELNEALVSFYVEGGRAHADGKLPEIKLPEPKLDIDETDSEVEANKVTTEVKEDERADVEEKAASVNADNDIVAGLKASSMNVDLGGLDLDGLLDSADNIDFGGEITLEMDFDDLLGGM